MSFLPSQRVELTATFRNEANVLADPTTVAIMVEDGDGVVSTYNYPADGVTHPSTGIYKKLIDIPDTITITEVWTARAEGTGDVQAPAETQFVVEPAGI